MDLDEYVCLFCETRFNSPGELAAHEQAEEDKLYVIDSI